ncbi:TPA: hypothetical protein IAB29_02210 [Candidatus Ventrenecus stercoripullorum]|nr:hypothetical protein [Candidatus Ventrenecus stercoripullorum]
MKLKYKILMAIIAVAVGLCLMIYQSYALWVVTLSGQENIVEVGCFNIEFIENTSSIALSNSYPVSDEKGMSGEAYSFTITNKCTVDSAYQVTLNTLNANTMGDDKVKYVIYKDNESKPSIGQLVNSAPINADKANITVTDLKESYIIASGELKGAAEENGTGESHTYNVYLWIDESAGNEVENTRFEASINIVNASTRILEGYEKCVQDYGEDNPECQIMANVDTTGSCPTVNDDGTVNVTSAESSASLICTAPDDYGTSYYFRGAVENNYVYFAGYYWRILRVNGDGSIRIIYDGTSAHANGESSTDRQIGTSVYNSSDNDNVYVGYMYGATGASTYNETHTNTNDSTIKTVVDNWYKTNIEDAGYSSYVSDTLFCNDRNMFPSEEFTIDGYVTFTQDGYGQNNTNYRWGGVPQPSLSEEEYAKFLTHPNFKCIQKNDRFTVADERTGNGSLSYPVALLTTDEAYLAGGYAGEENEKYYLSTGNEYWTMTPDHFVNRADFSNATGAYMRYVGTHGGVGLIYVIECFEDKCDIYDEEYGVTTSRGVRPVLNLKSGSLTGGSGTASDPYTVS